MHRPAQHHRSGFAAGAERRRRDGVAGPPKVTEPDPSVAAVEAETAHGRGFFEHQWRSIDGKRAHALASRSDPGAGAPPILLVHGSGLSGRYMIPTAQQLAPRRRVLLPDLPGFGASAPPAKILNVPELADWLVRWMTASGIAQGALLGNSFGCQVIADAAARYPERVTAAMLQGPTTPPEERSWFWQFVRWRQNQPYNPPSLAPITYQDYRKCGAARMYGSFKSQLSDRIEDKAPRIRAPVLVIRGARDPIANQRWCEQIARLCPEGSLALIPRVAHTLCYTAPVALAAAALSFLNGCAAVD